MKVFFEGWLKKWLYDEPDGPQRALMVAAALDMPVESTGGVTVFGYILDHIDRDDEHLLDVAHATLHVLHNGTVTYRHPPHQEVERQLAYAHSIWMATHRGLVSRAEPTAQDAFALASAPADDASAELKHYELTGHGGLEVLLDEFVALLIDDRIPGAAFVARWPGTTA